jgi:hypothetical protein
MADVDADLLQLGQEHVAQRYGLAPNLASRLQGTTLRELEDDAAKMRAELGLRPLDERQRDAGGRFAGAVVDMNTAIRRAAGRG